MANGMKNMKRTWSAHEEPPGCTWTEVAISGCPNGCKIYEDVHGNWIIWHNSNYGCKR